MILTDWVRNGPLIEVWKDQTLVAVFTEEDVLKMSNALTRQEGGDHYTKLKIQPMEFALANSLDFATANVVKYVVRKKGSQSDRARDLKKAIHCIHIIAEHEGISLEDN